MRTLKNVRTAQGLSQQELSRTTQISQATISNLEREITSPTLHQRTLLEQALGPLDWPVNREFSDMEKEEIAQAFALCINRLGPRVTINLFAKTRNNDELRGVASLFLPERTDKEPLDLPDHRKEGR